MGDLFVDPAGVHVAGSFKVGKRATRHSNWEDSIYRTTVVAQVGTEIQYKFLNGNVWGTDEGVPEECGVPMVWVVSTVRLWWQPRQPSTYCCYASCTTCLPPAPEDCAAGDCCGEGTIWDAASGTCVADGTSAGPVWRTLTTTEPLASQTSFFCWDPSEKSVIKSEIARRSSCQTNSRTPTGRRWRRGHPRPGQGWLTASHILSRKSRGPLKPEPASLLKSAGHPAFGSVNS